jgi:hypothetical protein
MSNWDTPPGGDFARYVEELSRQSLPHEAHREMTAPGAVAPAPSAPAPKPGSVGAKNAAAVAAAQRAAAARKGRNGPADPPFVSNASAPVVVQPVNLWKAVRPPVLAFIALEIASAFVPQLVPFTTPGMFLFIAWAVVRIVKMVGGSDAWQKAGRQIAEELKKQQRNNRG